LALHNVTVGADDLTIGAANLTVGADNFAVGAMILLEQIILLLEQMILLLQLLILLLEQIILLLDYHAIHCILWNFTVQMISFLNTWGGGERLVSLQLLVSQPPHPVSIRYNSTV
jgi:hypothetical protein